MRSVFEVADECSARSDPPRRDRLLAYISARTLSRVRAGCVPAFLRDAPCARTLPLRVFATRGLSAPAHSVAHAPLPAHHTPPKNGESTHPALPSPAPRPGPPIRGNSRSGVCAFLPACPIRNTPSPFPPTFKLPRQNAMGCTPPQPSEYSETRTQRTQRHQEPPWTRRQPCPR